MKKVLALVLALVLVLSLVACGKTDEQYIREDLTVKIHNIVGEYDIDDAEITIDRLDIYPEFVCAVASVKGTNRNNEHKEGTLTLYGVYDEKKHEVKLDNDLTKFDFPIDFADLSSFAGTYTTPFSNKYYVEISFKQSNGGKITAIIDSDYFFNSRRIEISEIESVSKTYNKCKYILRRNNVEGSFNITVELLSNDNNSIDDDELYMYYNYENERYYYNGKEVEEVEFDRAK